MRNLFDFATIRGFLRVAFFWRIWLFVCAFIATAIFNKNDYPFPYTDSILLPTGLPKWIWGFANFDGVHYIRTALWGYVSEYSQAFFPLYPLTIRMLSFSNFGLPDQTIPLISGLIISFFSFVGGSFFFYRIMQIDFKKEVSNRALWLFLFFPTSFYFVSLYTEGLFLLLSCGAIYLILKKYYLYAGILIALATATRITGIFICLIFVIELFKDLKNGKQTEKAVDLFPKLFGLFISVAGLVLYMFYLYYNYHNPLYFLTAQPVFGASRQVDQFVLLPQVFFRYLKILMTVPFFTSQFFSAIIELVFSLFGLFLLVISYKKVRFSFWIFSLCVYILPTLTGTLSSMPRYVLLLFLLFPAFSEFLSERTRFVLAILFGLQALFTALFILGYWIA